MTRRTGRPEVDPPFGRRLPPKATVSFKSLLKHCSFASPVWGAHGPGRPHRWSLLDNPPCHNGIPTHGAHTVARQLVPGHRLLWQFRRAPASGCTCSGWPRCRGKPKPKEHSPLHPRTPTINVDRALPRTPCNQCWKNDASAGHQRRSWPSEAIERMYHNQIKQK